MGENVKVFQAKRNVNCVLSFLSSVREANLPTKNHFLTILNYILLKNTKKVLQLFEKQLSQFKCSASLKKVCLPELIYSISERTNKGEEILYFLQHLLFIIFSKINFKIP